MEEQKVKINLSSGDGAIWFGCFATFWLTVGEPDIIDAVVHYLMK